LEYRRISAKSIAEQLGISRERVGVVIHEDLAVLVACFLPGRAKDLSPPLCIHFRKIAMQIGDNNVYFVLFLEVILLCGTFKFCCVVPSNFVVWYLQNRLLYAEEQLAFIFSPLIHHGEEAGWDTAPA
jgi:hypothetical protein